MCVCVCVNVHRPAGGRTHCEARRFDLPAIGQAAASAGNLAIPLIKELTDLVAKSNKEAARYVHWGATSQDAIDTGLVLQLRDAFHVIESDLQHLCETLVQMALDIEPPRCLRAPGCSRPCRPSLDSKWRVGWMR